MLLMISGIQKLSLVDYPQTPSFVIFLSGCNMKCPFCHNESVVKNDNKNYEIADIIEMITIRKNFLDGIVISGGEPTLYGSELIDLLKILKPLGLKVKLDTNGTNPDILKEIMKNNLIDYIAMDIKNTFNKYNETCGKKVDISKIKESINLIETSGLEYEFRTTLNKEMHNLNDIENIVCEIKNKDRYFLQPYKYSEHQLVNKNFGEFLDSELESIDKKIKIAVEV